MTIRFAAPPGAIVRRMNARAISHLCTKPANDDHSGRASDAMLHAALRHFARHGLAAAHRARREAEAALLTNDDQGYQWWLDICRTLDRQMATEFASRALKSN